MMLEPKKISNYLDDVSKKHLYKLFGLFIIILSIIFCFLYISKFQYSIDDNYRLVFSNIPFGHGPLIENLVFNNLYEGKFIDRIFIAQKMPLLPILIYLFAFISHNFFFIIICKNLLLFFILIYFLKNYILSNDLDLKKIFIYFLVYLIPYNMFVSLNFEYADCLISILLPSLFLALISKEKNKYIYASILIFFLYLTKNSLLFISIIIPVYVILFERDHYYRFKKFTLILGPLLAIIIWGSFTHVKSGKFAFGSNMLSVNSMGMNIALSENFLDYYPMKSLDLIHNDIQIPKELKTEWEISDYFEKLNMHKLQDYKNIKNYLLTFPEKIRFILFEIRRDAALPDSNGNFDNSIRYSMIFNKIILNLSIITSIVFIYLNIKNKKKIYIDLLYILFVCCYTLPFVLAWSTSKHLVPIIIISYLYILHQIFKKNISLSPFKKLGTNIN